MTPHLWMASFAVQCATRTGGTFVKRLSVLEQSVLLEALFDYAEEADEDNEAVANTLYQRFKDQFNAEESS